MGLCPTSRPGMMDSSSLHSDNLRLALLSVAVLGFRHGLDYDHIAAITDISSVQAKARDAMRFGLLYVLGHATTVAVPMPLAPPVMSTRLPSRPRMGSSQSGSCSRKSG